VTEGPYRTPYAIAIDEGGSVFVAGSSNLTSSFNNYSLLGYDASGAKRWERTYAPYGDSHIADMVLDRGAPIVTGEYGYCYGQIGTTKHSASGDQFWFDGYNASQGDSCHSVDYGESVALDAQRNIYVAGYTSDTVGPYRGYKPTLLKYSQFDGSPPVTTATVSGTAGQNGWYVSPGTLDLVATDWADEATGVKELHWSLDGAPEVVGPFPGASIAVTGEGYHTLTFYAVDNAGNVEGAQAIAFPIDQTPPTVSVSVAPSRIQPNGKLHSIQISGSYDDAFSGVMSSAVVVTDSSGQVVATGDLWSTVELLGRNNEVYTFTATVTDAAGHSAQAVATVKVN
jgi:hypothetical protein